MPGRGVPRGPPEWGDVLCEPKWARKRRFESYGLIHCGLFFAATGIALLSFLMFAVVFGNLAPWRWDTVHEALRMIFWAVVIALLGAFTLWFGVRIVLATELEGMPFRVYEAGFTKRHVPVWQGLRRRETLVPWDRLRSVKVVTEISVGRGLDRRIEIVFDDGGSEPVTERVRPDDPHVFLRAVTSHAEGALDASTVPFLAKGVGRLTDVPLMVLRRPPFLIWTFLPIFLLLWLLFVPMLGLMQREGGWASEATVVILGGGAIIISLVISIFIIWFGLHISEEHYRWAVFAKARLVGDALILPPRGPARFMLRTRQELPIGEIVEVRRFLDPDALSQHAMLRTVAGEEFGVRLGLLSAFAEHPSFEMGDYAAVNTGALEVQGEQVIKPRWERAVLLTVVPILMLAYVVVGPVVVETQDWGDASILILIILGYSFVLFFLAFLRLILRISRRGFGLKATPDGINYPSMLGIRRSIPRRNIRGISIRYRHLLGYHLSVRTNLWRVTFPIEAQERLVDAGFVIEDPEDVLAGL